jgi:hypothetical protein
MCLWCCALLALVGFGACDDSSEVMVDYGDYLAMSYDHLDQEAVRLAAGIGELDEANLDERSGKRDEALLKLRLLRWATSEKGCSRGF